MVLAWVALASAQPRATDGNTGAGFAARDPTCDGKALGRYRLFMGLTLLCGAAFLAVKVIEYGDKLSHGLVPATNNFLGLYFTMTGLHAVHVAAGMVVNGYLFGPGTRMWHAEPERFRNRVEVAGIYWHFVDVVWIFLFPVLYLL
jgi:heme/copper-type cytochrome/quinol oxidase subunit 3